MLAQAPCEVVTLFDPFNDHRRRNSLHLQFSQDLAWIWLGKPPRPALQVV